MVGVICLEVRGVVLFFAPKLKGGNVRDLLSWVPVHTAHSILIDFMRGVGSWQRTPYLSVNNTFFFCSSNPAALRVSIGVPFVVIHQICKETFSQRLNHLQLAHTLILIQCWLSYYTGLIRTWFFYMYLLRWREEERGGGGTLPAEGIGRGLLQ